MTTPVLWNEKRDQRLKELLEENLTCSQIAARMGLTDSQVERRVYRLNLNFSGSKVVPKSKPKRDVPASVWNSLLSRPPVRSPA